MKDLFFMGGALFMSILTILLIVMTVWMIYHALKYLSSNNVAKEIALRKMEQGRSIGLFAMIFGILGQLIGLYGALSTMAETSDISPAIVYAGIKVSMITTLYGLIIYLISLIMWFISLQILNRK